MATDRALIRRRRIFLAGEETDTGTLLPLTATQGVINAFDREFNTEIEMTRRERQDGFGFHTSVPGARKFTLPVTTHLHGAGASGVPYWAFLFKVCGFTVAASTYTLGTGLSEATASLGIAEDGRLREGAGACGTFGMTFAAGMPVPINWDFTGKLLEPSASALPAPTFPSVVPPRFASATLTIGGTSYKISEVGFTLNGEVTMREDATADDDGNRANDGTGFHAAQVVSVDPVFTLDPEASASKNWFQDWMDGDTAALNIVVGTAANNIMTINAPAVQPREVQGADRNNLIVDQLTMECTGATLMTIAFS